jgi:cytidylate kinase
MKHRIISISRQFGSGGHAISEALAKALSLPLYDRELISIAAKESGLGADALAHADETAGEIQQSSSFLGLTTSDTLFLAQTKVIRALAQKEDCIIVGRCSDVVLLEEPNVDLLRVYIHAPFQYRLQRIKTTEGLTTQEATRLIRQKDKERRIYFTYYTDKEWGAQSNYDLSLNSAYWPLEKCVALLSAAFENIPAAAQ